MATNTEFAYRYSGVTGDWVQPRAGIDQIRNSGGIVNIAGPVIVHSILIAPASGRYDATSSSGVVLAVNHATSGQFAQLSGQELFRFDAGSHSGLGTGNLTATPPSLVGLNFLARSGVVTLNSGTHIFDIIVTYEGRITA